MTQRQIKNPDRRDLLGNALVSLAAAGVGSLVAPHSVRAAAGNAVRPFRVSVPDSDLVDLRNRLLATRWPDRETVADESQGVPLATMQELTCYWATGYDWRRCEAKLNGLPNTLPRSTGWTSTSSTFGQSTRRRFR